MEVSKGDITISLADFRQLEKLSQADVVVMVETTYRGADGFRNHFVDYVPKSTHQFIEDAVKDMRESLSEAKKQIELAKRMSVKEFKQWKKT